MRATGCSRTIPRSTGARSTARSSSRGRSCVAPSLGKAAAVILYHNHPSGDPTPSREDREFTRRLALAAESVGVRLLDHVVVGREGCVSFREAGLL